MSITKTRTPKKHHRSEVLRELLDRQETARTRKKAEEAVPTPKTVPLPQPYAYD